MKIFRCVKFNKIGQKFGEENTAPHLLAKYQSICRSPGDCLKGHNGWDLAAPYKAKVYWDCDIQGTVVKTQIDNKLGWGITVLTESPEGIIQHRFWHLIAIFVKVGDKLDTGRVIGFNDTTGWATGPHVHRDIKPMIDINGSLKPKYDNNGYFGAVDIEPFYEDIFVLDKMAQLNAQKNNILKMIPDIIKKIFEILKGRKN